MGFEIEHCLRIMSRIGSVEVWDNIAQKVTPGTLRAGKGNTCSNGPREELIGILMSRCR